MTAGTPRVVHKRVIASAACGADRRLQRTASLTDREELEELLGRSLTAEQFGKSSLPGADVAVL